MRSFPIKKSLLTVLIISASMLCVSAIASLPPLINKKIALFESSSHGKIGVSAVNTFNNEHIQYRGNERFPFCSTSKVIAVGTILKRSMQDNKLLSKHINYKSEDMVSHSPVTERYLKQGMTISALSEATLITSDNSAMNLLLKELGGTLEVTKFARSLGDDQFRLDRWEPELSSSIPGDKRDTTTPTAMEKSLQSLILGNVLDVPQREQLLLWLKDNTTGNTRIRAGVPLKWVVGDKTGSGDYGTTNDIAVIYPPHCKPIVLVVYFTQRTKEAERKDEVIAEVTRMVLNEFSKSDKCIKNAL